MVCAGSSLHPDRRTPVRCSAVHNQYTLRSPDRSPCLPEGLLQLPGSQRAVPGLRLLPASPDRRLPL